MRALLISTYELGRQPFGLASPAAWLRGAGWDVECVDAARDPLRDDSLTSADLVGFHLPMHTATRLAGPIMTRARRLNRAARLCAYGLYAPLNEQWLRSLRVDDVLGGEFEAALANIARRIASARPESGSRGRESDLLRPTPVSTLPRLRFLLPDRSGLPPLSRYATLQMADGTHRVVGSTEASRGCRHLCRHCPVVPVYNGQFRIVQAEVVLADIDAQAMAGAEHVTFGDPDFFNGPTHAMRIVDAVHAAHPTLTYDVTIKIEHLLQHRDFLPRLAATGCAFVTSAVESLDDEVLALLEKGHTRADFVEAVALCRAAGVTLVPTFVAFHPWTSFESYRDILDTIALLDLVDHVAPIQFAIRLLVPEGSRMLQLEQMRRHIGVFDPETLSHRWTHAVPELDALHQEVTRLVGARPGSDRRSVFDEIRRLTYERAGLPPPTPVAAAPRTVVPYLSEPWYCCAEPNPEDVRLI